MLAARHDDDDDDDDDINKARNHFKQVYVFLLCCNINIKSRIMF